MAKSGPRHPLMLYRFMLDRWWPVTLWTGIMLLVLALGLGRLPGLLPQYTFMVVTYRELWTLAGIGGLSILFSLFLMLIRSHAYVQLFENHLRLTTPFLRLNIAYRRIEQTSTSELQQLFPPKRLSNWRREMLRPLAARNVVVLSLAGYPVSRILLRFFLSPFFFPDKSPKLALLVPDWIKFSSELESRRGALLEKDSLPGDEDPRARLLREFTRPRP